MSGDYWLIYLYSYFLPWLFQEGQSFNQVQLLRDEDGFVDLVDIAVGLPRVVGQGLGGRLYVVCEQGRHQTRYIIAVPHVG